MRTLCAVFWLGTVGCLSGVLFAGTAAAHARAKLLHSFGSGEDGRNSFAGVIDANDVLYGTDAGGGVSGKGAVFALNLKTGAEKVSYSFCSLRDCADGSLPVAGLIEIKGELYGTTEDSGAHGHGTVFALDAHNGTAKALYAFCSQQNCTDGAYPEAGLIDVKGSLYGTTIFGGPAGDGTVFAIDPNTGAETVVYSFCSVARCTDGRWPNASLIDVNGTLYGTTYVGGKSNWGTVFALDPATGTETVLYSFCSNRNCTDGVEPHAGVIDANGTLYGTTEFGGANCLSDGGCGTVFALDPHRRTEKVLYSFCSRRKCSDGAYPEASLIDVGGALYATTQGGGRSNWGTVFALDPATGTEKALYSFCSEQNCADGAYPDAGLIDVKGKLYGTTEYGGAYSFGTLFELTP